MIMKREMKKERKRERKMKRTEAAENEGRRMDLEQRIVHNGRDTAVRHIEVEARGGAVVAAVRAGEAPEDLSVVAEGWGGTPHALTLLFVDAKLTVLHVDP